MNLSVCHLATWQPDAPADHPLARRRM